jgi:hypothetical protein
MAGIWWLASYPKSGNTWVRAVIAALTSGRPVDINALHYPGAIASNRVGFDDALAIDSADLSFEQESNLRPRAYEIWAAEAKQTLFCKAHDAYHATPAGEPLFPTAATLGAVYVTRDPRAIAVSFAHHFAQPIDAAIARMADQAATFAASTRRLPQQLHQRLGRWSDHVESWLAAPFPIHLVRYEDMHAEPNKTFTGLAAFLGLPRDGGCIAAAIESATFARLQAQEREAGFIEKPPGCGIFFREGRVDGWREVLTADQTARIVAVHGAVMRRLGYDAALGPVRRKRDHVLVGD